MRTYSHATSPKLVCLAIPDGEDYTVVLLDLKKRPRHSRVARIYRGVDASYVATEFTQSGELQGQQYSVIRKKLAAKYKIFLP